MTIETERVQVTGATNREAIEALHGILTAMTKTIAGHVKYPRLFPVTIFHTIDHSPSWDKRSDAEKFDQIARSEQEITVSLLPGGRVVNGRAVYDVGPEVPRLAFLIEINETADGAVIIVRLEVEPFPFSSTRYRELVKRLRKWADEHERQQNELDVMRQVVEVLQSNKPVQAELQPAPQQPRRRGRPPRRENVRMRVITGLICWRAKLMSKSEADVCLETGLMSYNAYRDYRRDNLVFTDNNIRASGVTWHDLWIAHTGGQLDATVEKIVEKIRLAT